MTKNCHVIIPKFVLKSFSYNTNDGKKVCCYYFKDNEIIEEKISKAGTIEHYYSDKTESYLQKKFENVVGDLKKNLFSDSIKAKKYTDDFIKDIVRKFIWISIMRNPTFHENMIDRFKFNYERNITVDEIIQNDELYNPLKNKKVIIYHNKTDKGLISSYSFVNYLGDYFSEENLVVVLSPNLAFAVSMKEEDNDIYYHPIYSLDELDDINKNIFNNEQSSLNNFIVGHLDDLTRVVELQQKRKKYINGIEAPFN